MQQKQRHWHKWVRLFIYLLRDVNRTGYEASNGIRHEWEWWI